MRTGTNSLTILFFKNLVNRMFTKVDVLLQAFFCKRFSKKFIFILKLALTNYQPALALSCKRLCNILNKSLLLYSLFLPNIHPQRHFCKRFLQHVAFFSSKFAFFFLIFTINSIPTRDFCNMLHFSLLNSPRSANLAAKNAKAPGAGKPASRAIMINFILLSVPSRISSDNGTRLHG